MSMFPDTPQKIRARIRRYERDLRKEQEEFGSINDGYGKRYLLGALYLLLGDTEGGLKSYAWYEKTFGHDTGEPYDCLCWALTLYRAGDLEGAARKLQVAMMENLYLIPVLIGIDQETLDFWHSSNFEYKSYAEEMPPELFALWDTAAREWAAQRYFDPTLQSLREKYIALQQELKGEPVGPKRSAIVAEISELRGWKKNDEDEEDDETESVM
jgi:hypothetical protein